MEDLAIVPQEVPGSIVAPMRARLSDIARQAEVSEATVSRVLNDRPGVSADTRQAVLTALDVLGYERPERLRKRSAGLVGLIVPELENPIFPAFAQIIESALAQSGFTPVLCTQTPGGVTEDEYVEMLLDRQVSGIVFVSGLHADTTADHDRYQRLVGPPAADRADQRLRRGDRRPVHLLRRPAGRRAGGGPPGRPRAPPDRLRLRPGPVHAPCSASSTATAPRCAVSWASATPSWTSSSR